MSNENKWAAEGPAVHVNRFLIHLGHHARIAFGERVDLDADPSFRSAVLLSVPDALELAEVIQKLAKEAGYTVERPDNEHENS